MSAISSPWASTQPLTANWRAATIPVGSTCRVGTPTSSPYLSLHYSLSKLPAFPLLVLDALPLQPQWFKRLRVAKPLAPMVQHSTLTHSKVKRRISSRWEEDLNPQSPLCVALGLVTASPLAPACSENAPSWTQQGCSELSLLLSDWFIPLFLGASHPKLASPAFPSPQGTVQPLCTVIHGPESRITANHIWKEEPMGETRKLILASSDSQGELTKTKQKGWQSKTDGQTRKMAQNLYFLLPRCKWICCPAATYNSWKLVCKVQEGIRRLSCPRELKR